MFKIADGREQFYQWDLDRQVIVDDPSIVEVHFCNRTDDCSLVTEVIDGRANVPNILLQSSFDIRVFGYDGKATLHDKKFKVNARTRPSDYVYTETVIKSIDEILTAAEQVSATANELYEFVDEYKMGLVDDSEGNVTLKAISGDDPSDLSNYYTKAETDEKIEEAVEAVDVDLSDYYTKEEVDTSLDDMYEATVIYRMVKPDSEPTPDSMDGNKVQITDAHTIEFLNRLYNGEAVLGYTWRVNGLQRYLITDFVRSGKRLTLKAHRLFVSTLYHYTFYLDPEDDGNWYWAGYAVDEYDIQKATEETVQTALNNIGVAEGGSY